MVEASIEVHIEVQQTHDANEAHQPCPNLVHIYTSVLGFRASFSLVITVYIYVFLSNFGISAFIMSVI